VSRPTSRRQKCSRDRGSDGRPRAVGPQTPRSGCGVIGVASGRFVYPVFLQISTHFTATPGIPVQAPRAPAVPPRRGGPGWAKAARKSAAI
jgi:hypothetical protein